MKRFKLNGREVIESSRVFDLSGGPVKVYESETHEFYRAEIGSPTRLVISNAIDRTQTFIAKARDEFSDLNSLLGELVPR